MAELFCRAGINVLCEIGSVQSHDNSRTRPADILVPNWYCSRPAALYLTVISPLNSIFITKEVRKHSENDQKCEELGWICVSLAVEASGAWGMEAQHTFSRLARFRTKQTMSRVITGLSGHLNMSLVKANSRAILSRIAWYIYI